MKRKDIALILVVAIISGTISLFVARDIFTNSKDRKQTAEVVQPITTDFQTPSNKYFNNNSIDPTQDISIGGGQNTAPFSSQQQ